MFYSLRGFFIFYIVFAEKIAYCLPHQNICCDTILLLRMTLPLWVCVPVYSCLAANLELNVYNGKRENIGLELIF